MWHEYCTKAKAVAVVLLKRFFLGWYGVEKRLAEIEAKIDTVKDKVCGDCPLRENAVGTVKKTGA